VRSISDVTQAPPRQARCTSERLRRARALAKSGWTLALAAAARRRAGAAGGGGASDTMCEQQAMSNHPSHLFHGAAPFYQNICRPF
jgi:hypothetical protein